MMPSFSESYTHSLWGPDWGPITHILSLLLPQSPGLMKILLKSKLAVYLSHVAHVRKLGLRFLTVDPWQPRGFQVKSSHQWEVWRYYIKGRSWVGWCLEKVRERACYACQEVLWYGGPHGFWKTNPSVL